MFLKTTSIEEFDSELFYAISNEARRQEEHIELIASENYASLRVLEAQGSVLTNKYAEGYPGKRYYGGCDHVDVAEQLFYQIKGDMILRIIEKEKPKDIKIREGELFLLPPMVPHSPQRFKDTIGIVIERTRNKGELDGFQWYCDKCNSLIYARFEQITDIVSQLPIIFSNFWGNKDKRICKKCNHMMEEINCEN